MGLFEGRVAGRVSMMAPCDEGFARYGASLHGLSVAFSMPVYIRNGMFRSFRRAHRLVHSPSDRA